MNSDQKKEYSERTPEAIEAELKKTKRDYERLKDKYSELKEEYEKVAFAHNEVLHSFYWRVTAPMRFITQALKKGLYKYKITRYPCKALAMLFRHGIKNTFRAVAKKIRKRRIDYYSISSQQRTAEEETRFSKDIKISILVPLYNTPQKYLEEMINSVTAQTYSNWELCLADGSDAEHSYVEQYVKQRVAEDPRIVYKKLEKNLGISDNTNACIEISSGDYIGLFDHDDLLHPSVLFEVMRAICDEDADFIYTDELTFVGNNTKNISVHNFKPDYSPDTLRSYNYICHFSVFSRELMEKAGGGFRKEYDGSQDYDLILRLTEKASHISHIRKALYFWRSHAESTASSISAKPYIIESAHKALAAHLERVGLSGEVLDGVAPSIYRINYDIKGEPLISILIPNKDHIDDLKKCIDSIYSTSTYSNFEIIVIENNSTEKETFEYYKKLEREENIRVVYWEREFNYSAINNFGAESAKGDYLLLLNNDMEIISPDWLEQMLMLAQRDDIGAVGAKLYYPDDTVQHAGVILGIGGVAGHSHKYFRKEDPGFMSRASIIQNLTACTAACLMIPKAVYEEVGGLDEGYAVAFNDVDLCMKIRKAGYLIAFNPYCELYHYESKSRGAENTKKKIARFNSEIDRFVSRWSAELDAGDPYYNPNLTIELENFEIVPLRESNRI